MIARHKLIDAIENRELDTIKNLLAQGVDPNIRDDDGCAPVVLAITLKDTAILGLLLKAGADPDTRLADCMYPTVGGTILHQAACFGRLLDLRLLLDHGADVNIRDNSMWKKTSGQTPLMSACNRAEYDRYQAFEMLLQGGADVNLVDALGRTALMHLVESTSGLVKVAPLTSFDQVRSTDPLFSRLFSEPAVVAAELSKLSEQEIQERFRKYGDKLQETGPILAEQEKVRVIEEAVVCAERLLEAGAQIDHQDNYGFTALMLACRENRGCKLALDPLIDMLSHRGARKIDSILLRNAEQLEEADWDRPGETFRIGHEGELWAFTDPWPPQIVTPLKLVVQISDEYSQYANALLAYALSTKSGEVRNYLPMTKVDIRKWKILFEAPIVLTGPEARIGIRVTEPNGKATELEDWVLNVA